MLTWTLTLTPPPRLSDAGWLVWAEAVDAADLPSVLQAAALDAIAAALPEGFPVVYHVEVEGS